MGPPALSARTAERREIFVETYAIRRLHFLPRCVKLY